MICAKSRARPPGKKFSLVLFLAFTWHTYQGTHFRDFVSFVVSLVFCLFVCVFVFLWFVSFCVSGPHWWSSSTKEQAFSELGAHEQGEAAAHARAVRRSAQVFKSPLQGDFYSICTRTLSLRECDRWTSMLRERRWPESMTTVTHTYQNSEKSHGYLTVSTGTMPYLVLGHWNLHGQRGASPERRASRHGRILKSD